VFSIRKSRNLLVFKTGPGQAPAPALALDNLHLPGIVGTVAGDDTFLAVLEEDADWDRIHRNMLKLVGLPG
jgi:transcriptional regulator of arginine metabolism